ncbi:MAG: EF-hand domain-containing protein, partial [Novosphingobium sp.]
GGGGDGEGKGGGGGETSPSNGPPADSHPMGAGKYGLINLPEPIAAMDVDISGRITRREVADAASYRFGLLDPQGKGVLTLADLPQTFAQGHKGIVRKRRH